MSNRHTWRVITSGTRLLAQAQHFETRRQADAAAAGAIDEYRRQGYQIIGGRQQGYRGFSVAGIVSIVVVPYARPP